MLRFIAWMRLAISLAFSSTLVALVPTISLADDKKPADEPAKISYYTQVRPIFQTHCNGCHQPAKASGNFVMTAFEGLLKGGESEQTAIKPGKPDDSYLITLVTPEKGKASMPKDKQPLADSDIALITQWIVQGAKDDTPASEKQQFDMSHPPVYTKPPVITSLDFSPDGSLLAVAGFNEVLLAKADGSGLAGRLVGISERIETVRFSPDGKRLLVVGGQPCRVGEVQVWDVEKRELKLSAPYTYDTLYGGSWSPDGKLISFGCADNTVRAINAETGAQVLFQGAHTDWVRDTVFSTDGSHLVSVGRDMTVKLTEVATQRFVDNVTSITPGVLKGGVQALDRHPKIDHVVTGSSDGTPKVYRLFREAKRVIGDDANLIFELFNVRGRVFTVRFSADGKMIAAGSSYDNTGEVAICSYDYDADCPKNIKDILGKVPGTRSPVERKALEDYKAKGVKEIARVAMDKTGIYAVAFRPDGKVLATAGADGVVRFIDTTSGSIVKQFEPAPLSKDAPRVTSSTPVNALTQQETFETETLPDNTQVVGLEVEPRQITLNGKYEYTQLLVTGKLSTGDLLDVTRMVSAKASANVIEVSRSGFVRAKADGKAELTISIGGQTKKIAVEVTGVTPKTSGSENASVNETDFVRDVNPVLTRLGCNQGTCHGAAKGKNGFKLSLRGYDPIFDLRALTDDLASRRVNVASPDDSLMLMKPIGIAPHVGGVIMQPGEPYYEILRTWIANGAKLDSSSQRVMKIEVSPHNPIVQSTSGKQQIRVLATYPDGKVRDVTREAFIESGNTEVVTPTRTGVMKAERRGESPILVRYEGAYAATTLTVMGNRNGFAWTQPPANNKVDELAAAKWQRMKIQPSELCSDTDFLRRVYIDLTGLPPTADAVREFLADSRETRVKRDDLIDKLVGSEAFVDHWTNKWADLLQVNRKFLAPEGAAAFRTWIRERVANNLPYDKFAMEVLTASGSNRENPAASYYKILRTPDNTMENTTHLFLAVRFNCNKCHDHPFEKWTQDQYYETAAYFSQFSLQADAASGERKIGGTAVEGAKPLYEKVVDTNIGEMKHERTGLATPPKFPFDCKFTVPEKASRRQQLASWITSADNQYFAKSYVNRLWGYLLGGGIIEPIDDIRAGNPASNPELIEYLTRDFVESGFDMRHSLKLICKSRTYQLSVGTNKWNDDDKINYSHAKARRLPAEVLLDAVYRVTGTVSKFPGVAPGTRAASLPDSGIELPAGFLTTMGRPARESSCECERSNGLQLGPVMALISGPTIGDAISDPTNDLPKLTAAEKDDNKLVNEVFLRILNRPATEAEIKATLNAMGLISSDHDKLVKSRDDREAYYAPIREDLTKKREAAVATAKTELEGYEKQIAPRVAADEKKRKDRIAQLDADLKKFEKDVLPGRITQWELAQSAGNWIPLDPMKLSATTGTKLERQKDLSVVASGKAAKTIYSFTTETELRNITGIRLEAIADRKLPEGPGRSKDGNFVLNEFEVQAAPKNKPDDLAKVQLGRALADFNQASFDIKQAIDGDLNGQLGWAISGGGKGVGHWATFECKQPIGYEGGTVPTIKLYQQFNQVDFSLGRFRISVTTSPQPIGLTLPEDLRVVLATEPEKRNDQQKAFIAKYFGSIDAETRNRHKALADANQPLPIDPKLKELQEKLETVSRPVPEDPRLVQLKADVEQSKTQVVNQRLTSVQDLTWALINSPAFLFNH